MPITPIKYRIKDLPAIVQEADLVNKVLEVESPSGTDQNFKVSVPTLVQTVANNLPGGNNAKVAVKTARHYSPQTPGWGAGSLTLTELNPDFLCLFTTCWVEFPLPTTQYILVYDGTPGATLQVWRDGSFTGAKIGAKLVPVNSVEARVQGIADFSPFTGSYDLGDNVKYILGGSLRLFSARQALIKSTFIPAQIPAPSGLAADPNWVEINGNDGVVVGDFLPDNYQRHELVVFDHKLYRAKQDTTVGDFQSQPGVYDNFPDLDYWEVVSGSGGTSYNDAPLTARVASLEGKVTGLEYSVDYIATTVGDNYNEFNERVGLGSKARDYAPGAYQKDQLVTNNGILYKTKQAIQNSQVAPTATNVYWQQLGGGGGGNAAQNSLTPASAFLSPTVDAVVSGLATKENVLPTGSSTEYFRGDKSLGTLDKTAVGLGNADNTSDTNKPVSSATQTALNLKANLASPAFSGNPTAPTPPSSDNSSAIATTSYVTTKLGNQNLVGFDNYLGLWNPQTNIIASTGSSLDENTGAKGIYYKVSATTTTSVTTTTNSTNNDSYISVASTAGIGYGHLVAGAGIPAGTRVYTTSGSATVVLTRNVTLTAGVTLTFTPQVNGITSFTLNDYLYRGFTGWELRSELNSTAASGASIDYTNPTTLSANTTLTASDFGKHFKLAANAVGVVNTLTLPAISGNVNKLISVVVDNTCAGMWALQGANIDGETERRMWKAESAVLQCTDTGWTKIAGKTVPMMYVATYSGSSTINSIGTFLFDTVVDGTSAPSNMFDAVTHSLFALRKGKYQPAMLAYLSGGVQQRPIEIFMAKNGNVYHAETTNSPAPPVAAGNGAYYASVITPPVPVKLEAGEFMTAMYYSDNSYTVNIGGAIFPKFSLTEIPTW